MEDDAGEDAGGEGVGREDAGGEDAGNDDADDEDAGKEDVDEGAGEDVGEDACGADAGGEDDEGEDDEGEAAHGEHAGGDDAGREDAGNAAVSEDVGDDAGGDDAGGEGDEGDDASRAYDARNCSGEKAGGEGDECDEDDDALWATDALWAGDDRWVWGNGADNAAAEEANDAQCREILKDRGCVVDYDAKRRRMSELGLHQAPQLQTLAKELKRLVPRPPSAPPPGVLRGSALTPKAQQDQQEMPPPLPKAERPEPARANTESAGIRSTGQAPSRQESVQYGMPEPQEMGIELMQWCRNIEAEHMAIVRANNYHWLRVFDLMDYMVRRFRDQQSGLS